MKLDDWEMRAAFAAEDWPKVISIMESTFGIVLAGLSIMIHNSNIARFCHAEIWICMPESREEYAWSSQRGFSHNPVGVPLGEEIHIFPSN